ncbi:rubrerythrin family protein [Halonotius aquaticus]|jgi:rubrerythrin|uniref:Rubrerythrin family protein n=1 Tax=Halonotius aquaticus TaxID=2216978 RepID=A0A3A6Q0Y8_9EURY|nr:rubrerythrin family protein [Halonotius aquaticus]RJX45163.1 rubrerythrin family protein [Halonotius aquaticus]
MTASDFVDSVSEANQTALSRLGSSKSLYAETNGELETEQVLHAAAIAEDAASETFHAWADDEEHAEAAELFATVADEEADHYETVAGELDDPPQAADSETPAIQSVLRAFDDTVERVGGLVGRCLVAKKSKEQYTGYFTGQADPQTASLFRGLGDDVDAQIEAAADLVDAICTTDDDRERAHEAASEAIQAAYDEYTESLEAMGVNPKPVC